ncbi:hypothetical protein [Methanolobus sp. WCC4]|uniref:hypothetical protein n=1 Tax=Methanolobus sp. WCC4 TaxID=3125784 RepID=UPI0030F5F424
MDAKKRQGIVKLLLVLLVASIVLPSLSVQSYVPSGDTEVDIVYRDGLFGPIHKMVTDEQGVRMHVIDYPWYYFKDTGSAMNIYGIEGSSQSNDISFTIDYLSEYKEITFKQQNDLYFPDSIWNKYPEVTKARLVMYNGLPESDDTDFGLLDSYKTKQTVSGNWDYGETWTTTLRYYPSGWGIEAGNTYDYTVQESLGIDSPIPTDQVFYDTDRAFVHVTIPDPGATTATLTVTVLDNLKALPCSVQLLKDGQVYQQSVYLGSDGTKTFENLPFGRYSVKVLADDYETFFNDAYPAQFGYDYDDGEVELDSDINTCNYIIYGITDETKEDGSSGYDDPDNDIPSVPDPEDIIEDILDGDDEDGKSIAELLVELAVSLGLVAVVAFGLPLFLILLLIVLLIFYKKGEKDDK